MGLAVRGWLVSQLSQSGACQGNRDKQAGSGEASESESVGFAGYMGWEECAGSGQHEGLQLERHMLAVVLI